MDNRRFDSFVRLVGRGASRRTILKGLLGLGGSAAIGGAILSDSDARTVSTIRPTIPPPPSPTPKPVVTPTTTPTPTPDPCLGFRCGLDCCADELQCCDGECCPVDTVCLTRVFPEGPLVEEETCCPTDSACDDRCCDGTCFRPFGEILISGIDPFDRPCCPATATYCPHLAEPAFGLCCQGEAPDCCHDAEGNPVCITPDQCCTNDECPGECQICYQNQCVDDDAACPICQTCASGSCQPAASDPACTTNCCKGVCCPAGQTCVENTCQSTCLAPQDVCDFTAPSCCQDHPTLCSVEANCTTTQGEARCCRPIGEACADRCDCCENASCVSGTCQLDSGQQCLSSTECAGVDPECCSGTCRDLDNDVLNCGGCGFDCPDATNPGEIVTCIQGSCGVACADGYSLCGVFCVLTDSDENNCGACGNICPGGQTCCFGTCRDLNTDENSCGECGVLCPGTCCGGSCEDLLLDELNCGACGRNCFFELCGGDTSCPGLVVACCEGFCADLATDNSHCGECGTVCPLGRNCTGAICLTI